MLIVQVQSVCQLLRPSQPDRTAFDIHQQARTVELGQLIDGLESAIRDDQQALLLSGMTFAPHLQPLRGLAQCREQGRAAAGAQLRKPVGQALGGFQALYLPLRRWPAGGQQGHARPLPVSVIEQLREQALGIGQCAVPSGGGRGVDDDQPQLMGRSIALLEA